MQHSWACKLDRVMRHNQHTHGMFQLYCSFLQCGRNIVELADCIACMHLKTYIYTIRLESNRRPILRDLIACKDEVVEAFNLKVAK